MADDVRPIAPEPLGRIEFDADLGTAICEVTLTSPFGIQALTAKVPLIDILESVASLNLAICQLQRQLAAQMRAQLTSRNGRS